LKNKKNIFYSFSQILFFYSSKIFKTSESTKVELGRHHQAEAVG